MVEDTTGVRIKGLKYVEYSQEESCRWQPLMQYYMEKGELPALGVLFKYSPSINPAFTQEPQHLLNINEHWYHLLEMMESDGTLDIYARRADMKVCV